jgi:hypothetical protein
MTSRLYRSIIDLGLRDVVPPGQARGAFSGILPHALDLEDRKVYRRIGEALAADTVLVGHLFRWSEREGTAYAVNQPASVAFDLCMLRVPDGSVLWKETYDKTQQSLSENLLESQMFFKVGARWLTAMELADYGLEKVLSQFPVPE